MTGVQTCALPISKTEHKIVIHLPDAKANRANAIAAAIENHKREIKAHYNVGKNWLIVNYSSDGRSFDYVDSKVNVHRWQLLEVTEKRTKLIKTHVSYDEAMTDKKRKMQRIKALKQPVKYVIQKIIKEV